MPKISKLRSTSSRPGDPPKPKEELDSFRCTRCGKIYKRQRDNFPKTHSPLFLQNGGYMPICVTCLDSLFEHYKDALGSEQEAIKRMCLKLDIYWHPDLYSMINKASTSHSRIRGYISKTNLAKYIGKTYDDTLDEERNGVGIDAISMSEDDDGEVNLQVKMPDTDTILFWGSGFTPALYQELNLRFEKWTKDIPKPMDQGTEALYKQICISEITINRNLQNGKGAEQAQNALNNLLGSLNIKPNQKEDSQLIDTTPIGVWAKRWEDKRPIPEDDPELQDSYGVIKYISTWFFGHIGKMLGVKNIYSKLYEDKIAEMRVERPEFADEEDEDVFNGIFGEEANDDGNGGDAQ